MEITIIYDNFNAPFSDLVNKDLYDVLKVSGDKEMWVIRKKEEDNKNNK